MLSSLSRRPQRKLSMSRCISVSVMNFSVEAHQTITSLFAAVGRP